MRRLVQMRLPPELVERVDELARERAVSRTAVVLEAVERFLAEEEVVVVER